ncbi:MAG: 50S ribosomal protein L18 [Candidatus Diapherotrites archaeon]|nr:50S ribosomal protein L18 [Candidatus Diapherotrites archaeon]
MTQNTTYTMRFRRRREGKTDYHRRLRLLKSRIPRFVVRVLPRQVITQVINFNEKGDNVEACASSLELKKYGWKVHTGNVSAAYLTGFMCGLRAKKRGISEAVLDIGLHTPVYGSNVFAALKGALDAGINIPHDEKCLPAEEKIKGRILAQNLGREEIQKQFEAVMSEIEKKVK